MREEVIYFSKLPESNMVLLRHVIDNQVIEEKIIQNEEILKTLLRDGTSEIEQAYLDGDCLTFCLPPSKQLNRKLCFDQYSKLRRIPVLSSFFKRAYLELTEPKEVESFKPASPSLLAKAKEINKVGLVVGLCAVLTTTSLAFAAHEVMKTERAITTVSVEAEPTVNEPDEEKYAPSYSSSHQTYTEISENQTETVELVYNQPDISLDTQRLMKKIAEEYNIPFRYLITIADVESDGKFNNDGIVSYTKDYGIMQINEMNFNTLCQRLNTTPDMIRYDAETNIRASAEIISDIISLCQEKYGVVRDEEVYGCYNGWIDWRENEISVDYVAKAMEKQNTIYNDANMVDAQDIGMKVSK